MKQGRYIKTESLPLVSVVMIAYNVEDFIVEAIESVLAQKTKYPIELIIGEDNSTDNTREIVKQYEAKYPNIIKPIYNEKNLGLTPNFIHTHNHCNGKYIALLDGDDYWTDDNKIEAQIDFLEQNPEYAGTGHQSLKIYTKANLKPVLFGEKKDNTYSLDDMITHRKFHTSSFIYKKEIWDELSDLPSNVSSNERALNPGVAIFGKIKYFKNNMCVYRITGDGLTSRVSHKELKNDFLMLTWLKNKSKAFPILKFRTFLHLCMYTYGSKKVPFFVIIKHYIQFCFFSFSYFPRNLGDLKWGTKFALRAIFKKNG